MIVYTDEPYPIGQILPDGYVVDEKMEVHYPQPVMILKEVTLDDYLAQCKETDCLHFVDFSNFTENTRFYEVSID